jgi:hypothetical protein
MHPPPVLLEDTDDDDTDVLDALEVPPPVDATDEGSPAPLPPPKPPPCLQQAAIDATSRLAYR